MVKIGLGLQLQLTAKPRRVKLRQWLMQKTVWEEFGETMD